MPDNEELISGITGAAHASDVPQFSTAEYSHIPGTERCRICGNLISGEYYRVNAQMACAQCAGQAREGQPSDSHAAFARGLLLGAGAALLGLILYSTVVIVTGWSIGYLALAVGWLVGKGMLKGSNGMGGRRYQITAVLLTYAAISLSAVPIGIALWMKDGSKPARQTQSQQNTASTSDPALSNPEVTATNDDADATAQTTSKPTEKPSAGHAFLMLALFGIASPFLELADPIHGLIGLVILFVGLSIAFRLTASKPLDVDGPYSVTG
jgi:hypothetical protein